MKLSTNRKHTSSTYLARTRYCKTIYCIHIKHRKSCLIQNCFLLNKTELLLCKSRCLSVLKLTMLYKYVRIRTYTMLLCLIKVCEYRYYGRILLSIFAVVLFVYIFPQYRNVLFCQVKKLVCTPKIIISVWFSRYRICKHSVVCAEYFSTIADRILREICSLIYEETLKHNIRHIPFYPVKHKRSPDFIQHSVMFY